MAETLQIIINAKDNATPIAQTVKQSIGSIGDVADRVGLKLSALGAGLSLGITAQLKRMGDQSIESASSLESALSRVNAVFGSQAGDIQSWANSASLSLGTSERAALSAASTFGAMFSAMGLVGESSAEMSKQLVQLAGDLSSFYDIPVDVALEKLRSGLVGEMEPLRELGVNVSAAAVEAKALEMGILGVDQKLTAAGKAAASYALIMEDTKIAQGDLANTADSYANTQRRVQNLTEDLSTAIGGYLLPIKLKLLQTVQNLISVFADFSPELQKAVIVVAALAAALGPALAALGALIMLKAPIGAAIGAIKAVIAGLGAVISAIGAPVAIAIAAIVGLAIAWRNNWGNIQGYTKAVITWLSNAFKTFSTWLSTTVKGLLQNISKLWQTILAWIADKVSVFVEAVSSAIKGLMEIVSTIFGGSLKAVADFVRNWLAWVQQRWGETWANTLKMAQTFFDKYGRGLAKTLGDAAIAIADFLLWIPGLSNVSGMLKVVGASLRSLSIHGLDLSHFIEGVGDITESASQDIATFGDTLGDWMAGMGNKIGDVLSALKAKVNDLLHGGDGLGEVFKPGAFNLDAFLSGLGDELKGGVLAVDKAAKDLGNAVGDSIGKGIGEGVSESAPPAIVDAFAALQTALNQALSLIGYQLSTGLINDADALQAQIAALTRFAEAAFQAGFIDAASDAIAKIKELSGVIEQMAAEQAEFARLAELGEKVRQTFVKMGEDMGLVGFQLQTGLITALEAAEAEMAIWQSQAEELFRLGILDEAAAAAARVLQLRQQIENLRYEGKPGDTLDKAVQDIEDIARAWEQIGKFKWPESDVRPVLDWLTSFGGMVTQALSKLKGWNLDVTAGKLMEELQPFISAIAAIGQSWESVQKFAWSNLQVQPVIDWLTAFGGLVTQAVSKLEGWSLSFSDKFEEFTAGVRAAVGTIADAAKAWETLQKFTWGSFDVQPVIDWLAALGGMMAEAVKKVQLSQSRRYMDYFHEFVNGVRASIGLISDAAKSWEVLSKLEFKDVDLSAIITKLADFAALAAKEVKRAQLGQGQRFLEYYHEFVNGARAAMGAISDAVGAMEKLGTWKAIDDLEVRFVKFRQAFELIVREFHKTYLALKSMVDEDIAKFGEAVGDLMQGLGDALEVLTTDWKRITLPTEELWRPFVAWVGSVISWLDEWIKTHPKLSDKDLLTTFGSALSSIMQGLQAALSIVSGFTFKAPDSAIWQKFIDWTFLVFGYIHDRITQPFSTWYGTVVYTKAGLELANAWGSALSSVMQGLQSALSVVYNFKFKAPSVILWSRFMDWVHLVFGYLYERIRQPFVTWYGTVIYSKEGLDLANAWGSSLSSVMQGLQAALGVVYNFKFKAPSAILWSKFIAWVKSVFASFYAWVNATNEWNGKQIKMGQTGLTLVSTFGSALSSLMSGLQSALGIVYNFAFKAPSPLLWSKFIAWVKSVFLQFYTWVNATNVYQGKNIKLGQTGLDMVSAFGSALSSLMGGLQAALGVLSGAVGFVTPAESRLKAFESAVQGVMLRFATWARTTLTQADNDAVTAFGTAISSLFSGLQSAMSIFDALYNGGDALAGWLAGAANPETSPFARAMGALFVAITETLTKFRTNVMAVAGSSWYPAAEAFATATGYVFDVLERSLAIFGELTEHGLPSTQQLQDFISAVLRILSEFTSALTGTAGTAQTAASGVAAGIAAGLNSGITGSAGSNTVEGQSRALVNLLSGIVRSNVGQTAIDARPLGANVGAAIATGLNDSTAGVRAAALNLASAIKSPLTFSLQIASPSRWAIDFAGQVGAGLVNGLDQSRSGVESAAGRMAAAIMGPMANPRFAYAASRPVYSVRVEGDLSIGGQQVSPQTANQIATMLLDKIRLRG